MLLHDDKVNAVLSKDTETLQIPRTPLEFDVLDPTPTKQFVYRVLGYAHLFHLNEALTTEDYLTYEKGERLI